MVIEFEESHASNHIKNLFYQTSQMLVDVQKWADAGVFINTRLIRTRFRRNLVLFCGVDHQGKTVIFAVALLKDEKIQSFSFCLQNVMMHR